MATKINISALTLAAKENPDFDKFVFEQIYAAPELTAVHSIWTGLTMKEQIVFASLFGKVGVKDTGCARPTSGAQTVLTQKYWEPVPVTDTIVHCQSDVNALFKAYYDKIQRYAQLYEIQGSDEEQYLATRFIEAARQLIKRAVWLADKNVAASQAAAAGLIDAATNTKFYDYFDGLWAQIFDAVGTGDVQRYTITENGLGTKILQTTLAAGRSVEIFEGVWAKADARLKADPAKQLLVSNEIFENYRQYLQSKGENFTIDYTTEGLPNLRWNGMQVINMQTVWDMDLRADFEEDSTDHLYWLANRVVLTVPQNIPIGTLNENDFNELESWYNRDDRTNKMAIGFTLDAKLLEGYMCAVAY